MFIKTLRSTWRVQVKYVAEIPHSGRLIFCFWHGKQAGLFAYPHPHRIAVLSSLSRDGELQTRILRKLGFEVCRGSSSRGGAAGLKAIIGKIRGITGESCDAAFAADGPRGPLHKVKPGVIEAAKQSNALIVPIGATPSRAWVFEKAWDRYVLPKPFAQLTINVGAPVSPVGLTTAHLTLLVNQIGEK